MEVIVTDQLERQTEVTPDDLRWVRSGTNHLHGVGIPPVGGRTACGIALRNMWHTSAYGPRTPRQTIERGRWPMCQHCERIIEWSSR